MPVTRRPAQVPGVIPVHLDGSGRAVRLRRQVPIDGRTHGDGARAEGARLRPAHLTGVVKVRLRFLLLLVRLLALSGVAAGASAPAALPAVEAASAEDEPPATFASHDLHEHVTDATRKKEAPPI